MSTRSTSWLRRFLILVVAIPVVAVIADTGLWFLATSRLEAGVHQWVSDARSQGWIVEAGPPARGGWPLAAEVSFPDVTVNGVGPGLPLPLTWRVERVRITLALAHPRDLVVGGEGAQHLRFGTGPAVPFTGDTVELVTPLGRVGSTALQAVNLRLGEPGAASPEGGLTVATLVAHGGAEESGFRFDLDAVTVGLPQSYPWLFGPRLASLSVQGLLHGPLPASVAMTPAAAARAWRDGGGALDLRQVALDWGPLKGSLTGTFGLDGDLQPMGATTFRVDDYQAVLNTLAQSGRITRQAAMAATAVISLIGHASDQGQGGASAELPLKLQDRTLSLGRIPLAHMPELVWP
jgi:hypothetical protein